MMKKEHILHWAMGVMLTPLLGSCAADNIGAAGGTDNICDNLWTKKHPRIKNIKRSLNYLHTNK